MTSPLRRKRPTTARGRTTRARTAAEWPRAGLLALALWLAAGTCGAQQPRPDDGRGRGRDDAGQSLRIPLELPGPERLFRLDSEETLFERMKQEAREATPPERLTFPEEPVLARDPYLGRAWPLSKMIVEPSYLCHRRLYFEQLNMERYGWDLGYFGPLVSTSVFFKDVALLPYKMGTQPCRCYECSSGKCLPGDPVPLLLYPPELSLTGLLAEGAAIATLLVLFP